MEISKLNAGLFSSNKDDWETPQELFNNLNAIFHFTLDPCSTHENAKCEKHFTVQEDGLKQDWGGRQFFAILLMEKRSKTGCANVMKSKSTQI